MSELELILTKLKIVSEAKENGAYICDKEHSKILLKEIERLNNIIEKLEQENAVLKTQVVNKDKYSYGIRVGSE